MKLEFGKQYIVLGTLYTVLKEQSNPTNKNGTLFSQVPPSGTMYTLSSFDQYTGDPITETIDEANTEQLFHHNLVIPQDSHKPKVKKFSYARLLNKPIKQIFINQGGKVNGCYNDKREDGSRRLSYSIFDALPDIDKNIVKTEVGHLLQANNIIGYVSWRNTRSPRLGINYEKLVIIIPDAE